MIAYGTQRTLILESQNWRYATGGWETVFRPVSETCTDRSGSSAGHWSGKKNAAWLNYQVLGITMTYGHFFPYIMDFKYRTVF